MNLNVRKFEEWASAVYEGAPRAVAFTYFEKGDADHRSLFEYLLESADRPLNEALNTVDFDFEEADALIASAVAESIVNGNEEALNEVFGFIKKGVENALDGASDLIGKGVELGGKLLTSVKDIASKIKEAIKAVYEKIKKFLNLAWEWAREKGVKGFESVKAFLNKQSNASSIQALSKMLEQEKTDAEIKAASADIKATISKISGKTYNPDPSKAEQSLKANAEELEDASSEDIEDLTLDVIGALGESEAYYLMTSIKGLLMEGYTVDELNKFLNEEAILEEEGAHKKSMMGWLIEAIGFALSPFGKLYEKAIKSGTNSLMKIVSTVARGGIEKAYKYVVMGTVASLVYHIVHGIQEIGHHFEHANESALNEGSEVQLDSQKRLLTWDTAEKVMVAGLGAIFCKALKAFFPMVALLLEIVLVAVASLELIVSLCELPGYTEKAFCSVVAKVEHKFL